MFQTTSAMRALAQLKASFRPSSCAYTSVGRGPPEAILQYGAATLRFSVFFSDFQSGSMLVASGRHPQLWGHAQDLDPWLSDEDQVWPRAASGQSWPRECLTFCVPALWHLLLDEEGKTVPSDIGQLQLIIRKASSWEPLSISWQVSFLFLSFDVYVWVYSIT